MERIEPACVLDDDSAALALAAANCAEQQLTVVDVREVAVDVNGPTPRPLAALERMRTCGPSVRTDLGKQTGGDWGNR